MSVENELRKQTELMRRNTQVQRVNSLYGRGKSKGFVIGGGDLKRLTKEDWDEYRRLVYSGKLDEAQKFMDKKSGAWPWFVPFLIWIGIFVIIWQSYTWYLLTFYG